MSPRGARRKLDPSIPAHIDQTALPEGLYWDRSGKGRWRARTLKDGKWALETVAGPGARMSDLHRIMEDQSGGPTQGTVAWMLGRFHASSEFRALALATQRSYEASQKVIASFRTKGGAALGTLVADRLTSTNIQSVHERIVAEGHPSKANHALRYLRRVYAWAIPHLGMKANPARGVKAAKERARHTMPASAAFEQVLAFARQRAAYKAHTRGSVAPYLPAVMELAYALRLRGIEVVTLTDANALEEGILSNRRKGSRDNITRWTPRLRAAWDEALALRRATVARAGRPVQLRAEDRPLFVSEDGYPLTRAGLTSSFVRLMNLAIRDDAIAESDRFTLHGLKHRGMTDGKDKTAGGHRTEAMRQRYDHEIPVVEPAGKR